MRQLHFNRKFILKATLISGQIIQWIRSDVNLGLKDCHLKFKSEPFSFEKRTLFR